MKPVSSGYADINSIRLYQEIYGQGEPLVLIHGGLTTRKSRCTVVYSKKI